MLRKNEKNVTLTPKQLREIRDGAIQNYLDKAGTTCEDISKRWIESLIAVLNSGGYSVIVKNNSDVTNSDDRLGV